MAQTSNGTHNSQNTADFTKDIQNNYDYYEKHSHINPLMASSIHQSYAENHETQNKIIKEANKFIKSGLENQFYFNDEHI